MSLFKNNFVVGVTAALTATLIAPVLIPAIRRGSRPLAKSLIKGGILLYEKSREAVASAGEMMEDVVAEVRAETQQHGAAMADFPAEEEEAEEFTPSRHTGNGATSETSSTAAGGGPSG